MSQAIDYRLQKNPIVHHIANIYSSSIICAKRESVIKCIFTLCAINVHLSESCARGILLHWEYLGNPFTVLPPLALSMDRQPCGKRHRLCQCQKRENHQKHLTCRWPWSWRSWSQHLGMSRPLLLPLLLQYKVISIQMFWYFMYFQGIPRWCADVLMFEVLGHKKQYQRW